MLSIRWPWIKECILIQEFIKQIHQVLSMVPYLPNIEPQIAYLTENLRELVLHHIFILLFILSIKYIDGFWAHPMQKAPFQLLQWIWKEAAVVQLLSRVPLFATPRNVTHQPQSFTISWSFLKFMSTELAMLFKHRLRRTQTQQLMSTIWDAPGKGPMIPGLSWTFLWLLAHTCKPPPKHASHCSHPWFTGLGPDPESPSSFSKATSYLSKSASPRGSGSTRHVTCSDSTCEVAHGVKWTQRTMDVPWWLSGKESTCSEGDMGSIPGLGRSPREGNSNPLQYSCLGNPMDRRSLGGYSPRCNKESDMIEELNDSNNMK